jgi:hypothetical protein
VRTSLRRLRGFAVLAATAAGAVLVLGVLARLLLEAVAFPDAEGILYVSILSGLALLTIAAACIPFAIAAKRLGAGLVARMRTIGSSGNVHASPGLTS